MLAPLCDSGRLRASPLLRPALAGHTLNNLIELGPQAWAELDRELHDAVAAGRLEGAGVPLADCEQLLAIRVVDYVDFYASREHAENLSRLLRPHNPGLPENWLALPIGYHGRSSTVVVSGTPVRRPRGLIEPGRYEPTGRLDFECELGYVCGPGRAGPIAIDEAAAHIFGVVLVNDWSARDIQRVETVPLGPHQGKSFATSISAWVTPLHSLAAARVAAPEQDPPPPPHLAARDGWGLDVALQIELNGQAISHTSSAGLYWTPAQMLAQMTANGARLSSGDLFATGTISGAQPASQGSLAELGGGERWLSDGDEVLLRGRAAGIELGEVRGRVLAAG